MFANRVKKYGGTGGTGGNPGGDNLVIEFDGESQYIYTQNPVGHVGTAGWSVSLWVYYFEDQDPSISSIKYVWQDRADMGSGAETSGLAVSMSNRSVFLRGAGGWLEFTLTRDEIVPNEWFNFVLAGLSAGVQLFVNSVFKGTLTDYITAPNAYSVFGGTPFPDVSAGDSLACLIDDARIFDRQLIQSDVDELYASRNQEIATPPEYLQAFLDEGPIDGAAIGTGSIIDTSVAGNNLTPVDGPIYRLPPFVGVLEFDGVSQYLATSSPSGNGTGAFTVSLWVNYTDPQAEGSQYKVLWESRADMGSGQAIAAVAVDQTDRSLNIWYNNNWLRFSTSAGRITIGEFVNVVLTKTAANSFIIYIDTINCGTNPMPEYNVDGYSVFAGQPFYGDGRGDCLTCQLDDIRIFDYAFDQVAVNAMYGARNEDTPTQSSDLGKWFLDEGPDGAAATDPASIIDTSIAGNNLTPYNSPIYRSV